MYKAVEDMLTKANKLYRTQAFIISVDEDKPGMYQCKVLPDLLTLEDDTKCPWYPHFHFHKKEPLKKGDLIWVYVTHDLNSGYVLSKANSVADEVGLNKKIWKGLTDHLEDSGMQEVPFNLSIDYTSTFYEELFEGTYLFFDTTNNMVGFVNDTTKVFIKDGQIYVKSIGVVVETENAVLHAKDVEVKATGEVKIDASKIALNGSNKGFVLYEDMEKALNNFKSSINTTITTASNTAITNHTHVCTAPGVPSAPGIGAAIIPPLVLVPQPSKTKTIKTGG